MDKRVIEVKLLPLAEDLGLPCYATPFSSGLDLLCAEKEDIIVAPGARILVSTGLAIALPQDLEAQVRPRSGLALKHGITVLNAPGTIDADYRDEIKVIIHNAGQEAFTINRGMRIAQMVVMPVVRVGLKQVAELSSPADNKRAGGFGSTGGF